MQRTPKLARTTVATVLSRDLKSKGGRMTPEAARSILDLGINSAHKKRALRLLEKQREGTISPAEGAELESYVQADNVLSILKARAILALQAAGQEP
jgi:hypothetical protein